MADTTSAAPDVIATPRTAVPRIDLFAWYALSSFVLLALGGWLTSLGLGEWYEGLRKPWFQPPAWVFSVAWTTVLSALAIATWLVARLRTSHLALGAYWVQWGLNALWSVLFFVLEQPLMALIEITILDVVVVAMVMLYTRVQRTAGLLLLPYAVWLALATAINAWIVQNN